MTTIRNEIAHAINGVAGRLFALNVPPAPWKAGVFANQTWKSEARKITRDYSAGATLQVEIRFDDGCKNGHNSFSITATVESPSARRRGDIEAGGCLHDDIAAVFPELAPMIKWHMVSTDSPMHYVANTIYHASDRDHSGRAKGEATAWSYGYRFDGVPMIHTVKKSFYDFIELRRNDGGSFTVAAIAHENRPGDTYKFAPKFTLNGYGTQWHECPFDSEFVAQSFAQSLNACIVHPEKIPTAWSEGKPRDLNAARSCGVWPEATDEQLSAPKDVLKAALEARLPALQAAFREAMEGAGFMWEAPAKA